LIASVRQAIDRHARRRRAHALYRKTPATHALLDGTIPDCSPPSSPNATAVSDASADREEITTQGHVRQDAEKVARVRPECTYREALRARA
jgi:hypothetical protein